MRCRIVKLWQNKLCTCASMLVHMSLACGKLRRWQLEPSKNESGKFPISRKGKECPYTASLFTCLLARKAPKRKGCTTFEARGSFHIKSTQKIFFFKFIFSGSAVPITDIIYAEFQTSTFITLWDMAILMTNVVDCYYNRWF